MITVFIVVEGSGRARLQPAKRERSKVLRLSVSFDFVFRPPCLSGEVESMGDNRLENRDSDP